MGFWAACVSHLLLQERQYITMIEYIKENLMLILTFGFTFLAGIGIGATTSIIKLEILQSIIPILKFYYIDIIINFMLFFGGLGIGAALNEYIRR